MSHYIHWKRYVFDSAMDYDTMVDVIRGFAAIHLTTGASVARMAFSRADKAGIIFW